MDGWIDNGWMAEGYKYLGSFHGGKGERVMLGLRALGPKPCAALLTKVRWAALRISVLGPSPCPFCGQYCGVWPEASFISASQEPPESLAPSPNV
jgi:hypothetical protein